MVSNRSKKNLSLVHGQSIPNLQPGYNNMQVINSPQDGKIKNYYNMVEQNRHKSIEKMQNDLTKIYMVGGQQVLSPQQRQMQNDMMNPNNQQQIQYQNRQGTLNNSPSIEHLNSGVSGTGLQG